MTNEKNNTHSTAGKLKQGIKKVAAKAMAATGVTVNSLMVWLNTTFGLNIPTADSPDFPPILRSLWDLPVPGGIPSGQPPWTIEVDGTWSALFPQAGSPPVQLENIVVHVKQTPKQ